MQLSSKVGEIQATLEDRLESLAEAVRGDFGEGVAKVQLAL